MGSTLGAELCDRQGRLLVLIKSITAEDHSWLSTLFLHSKLKSDNLCNNMHVYAASVHWSDDKSSYER